MPFEVSILETEGIPVYQLIASKSFFLSGLGMSLSRIAEQLGVTDKTVAKAIAWTKRMSKA